MQITENKTNGHATTEERVTRRTITPSVNIYETKEETILLADLPGADESNVEITFEQDKLTISATPNYEQNLNDKLIYSEFVTGNYKRTFQISKPVDANGIKAVIKNGQLKLTLPKLVPNTKKIPVQSN